MCWNTNKPLYLSTPGTHLFLAGVELTTMNFECCASSVARLGYQRQSGVALSIVACTKKTPWNPSKRDGEFLLSQVSRNFFMPWPVQHILIHDYWLDGTLRIRITSKFCSNLDLILQRHISKKWYSSSIAVSPTFKHYLQNLFSGWVLICQPVLFWIFNEQFYIWYEKQMLYKIQVLAMTYIKRMY